jgi:hypothetical protein
MADVVAPANVGQRFARCPSCPGFLDLMGSERGLPAKLDTARLCPLSPFVRPSPDQFSFEFGKAAKNGQHKPAMWGSRIGPRIG